MKNIKEKPVKEVKAVPKTDPTVATVADLEALIARVKKAQETYATFTQEQVDKIFRAAALAANNARIPLALDTAKETGMGIAEDKVIKNHFAAEYIYNKYKNEKTCGIIEDDATNGMTKIADPIGIIAGVIPTTNPTSTVIFKTLMALKTRNAIVFSPHPRAKNCTIDAAKIVLNAAIAAGAPTDIIGWIEAPSVELSQALMTHDDISLILATGGPGMVKAAYSSGKPALGVGAGNTPVIIDETADIKEAVSSILISKTFDNGLICASEQALIVDEKIYEDLKEELIYRGAYILNKEQADKVRKTIVIDGKLNANIVGQPAYKIAELAGIKVHETTKVLVGEAVKVGYEEELSFEKLSPVLALYKTKTYDEAVKKATELIKFGGRGHTSVLYTNPNNQDRIDTFAENLKTGRILINTPASQGAIGDLYNFELAPSLTLGCGSWGGNSVSENVGIKHLLNIKSVAKRRENMLWFRVPPKVYFKQGATKLALSELVGKKKAFIVTDQFLFENGYTKKVTDVLDKIGVQAQVFADVKPDPTIATVNQALTLINSYQPDVIIALGGGSPIDAAKIMWLMYEQPELKFEEIAMTFMDIKKRIAQFPELGKKAELVAIPTTSGTGSEVTPFAVITDDETHIKYPIADYALTPNMAIVDPDLVMHMPKGLTAASGIDALTHAIETYVSVVASDYTNGMAMEAIGNIFNYLPAAYNEGAANPIAREKIHYASTMAGMAFANSFLGICHSMAHKLGAAFGLPHGVANALLINQVIKFNASERPTKQGVFSQYKFPQALERFAKIADSLKLKGKDNYEKTDALIEKITGLKKELNIPLSIKDAGVDENEFNAKLDELVTQAFDDQCTGANPRYPLMAEIKEIYIKAYKGIV